jgi:hypothetical protein
MSSKQNIKFSGAVTVGVVGNNATVTQNINSSNQNIVAQHRNLLMLTHEILTLYLLSQCFRFLKQFIPLE